MNRNHRLFMIVLKSKPAILLAMALLIHPPRVNASDADRELNLIGAVSPPQSGMTRAESGLSDADWTKHITLDYQAGCNNEDCCNQCKGWCGNDDDCYGIMKCLIRESATSPVPGCIVPPWGYGGNVCYLPDAEYYPTSVLPRPLITDWGNPCTSSTPCKQCVGLCDVGQDDQCEGDLRCSSFAQNQWPNGDKNCNENGMSDAARGYCMPAEDYYSPPPPQGPSADWDASVPDRGKLVVYPQCPPGGCPVCSAPAIWLGCQGPDVCAPGLQCYDFHDRDVDFGEKQVSGCSGNKEYYSGYCYTKDTTYKPPPIAYATEPPSTDTFVHTNALVAPEECAVYAVDKGRTFDVPFGGSSQVTTNNDLFHKVTYIYVIDVSYSTYQWMGDAYCGDANSDLATQTPIDCEILALEKVNEAVNAGGNVDLVGLISFNNTAKVVQPLIEPWARLSDDRRDPTIIDLARGLVPQEGTNYQMGVELACEMARDPKNDNPLTVVIFLSDGAPNLGTSVENTIKTNCNGAIFQTFAVTEAADCDKVDTQNLRPGIDDPDTLREISTFSGGECAKVPDVSKLPALLVDLATTTWDGVTVTVNGQVIDSPSIVYNLNEPLPFPAPGSYTYSGSVPLGQGQHEICLETSSSTSGIETTNKQCKMVVVNEIEVDVGIQQVAKGADAEFTVRFVGDKPGCDALAFVDKSIAVESCDGTTSVTTAKTGADGSVVVSVSVSLSALLGGITESCYKVCYEAPKGGKSCAQTIVQFTTGAPIVATTPLPTEPPSPAPVTPLPTTLEPSTLPSTNPSKAPVTPRPTTLAPSTSLSQSPSAGPITPIPTTSAPTTMSPSSSPSKAPITPEPTTGIPSRSPSGAPSAKTSSAPSSSPSNSPGTCDLKANIACAIKGSDTVTGSPKSCSEMTCSLDSCEVPVTYTYTVSAVSTDALVISSVSVISSVDGQLTMQMPALKLAGGESTSTTVDGVINCCIDSTYDSTVTVEAKTDNIGQNPCGASFTWSMATSVSSEVPSGSPSRSPSITPTASTPTSVPSKSNQSDSPSDAPSTHPVTGSPVTLGPTSAATASLYCHPLDSSSETTTTTTQTDSCKLCEPFRSPDYCDPSESFPSLVQTRTSKFRNAPSLVSDDGYWFHSLEDKIAGYLLSVDQGWPAPEVYCCVTTVEELATCLETKGFKEVNGGFLINGGIAIKATNFHSNQGVFILVNDAASSYAPGEAYDLIQKTSFTFSDVSAALGQMQASKIIVEEFIGASLPVEYKYHVISGKVQAVEVIQNRGQDCACYAVVDADFNRLDSYGCFEPGGTGYKDPNKPECTSIDFDTGAMKAGPVKKDMYLCDEVAKPDPCVLFDMNLLATLLGKRIGVAMRIDMFVANNSIYVQEYSPNPMNGLRHCAAKMDANGCIDSCFLGREWKAAGTEYGGTATLVPNNLKDYLLLSDKARCELISGIVPNKKLPFSSCAGG